MDVVQLQLHRVMLINVICQVHSLMLIDQAAFCLQQSSSSLCKCTPHNWEHPMSHLSHLSSCCYHSLLYCLQWSMHLEGSSLSDPKWIGSDLQCASLEPQPVQQRLLHWWGTQWAEVDAGCFCGHCGFAPQKTCACEPWSLPPVEQCFSVQGLSTILFRPTKQC